jgi:hypothetical protein
MNPATLTTTRPPLFLKPWVISCGLALAFSVPASAQSATNFDTRKISPKAAPQKAPAAKKENAAPANEAAKVNIVPSRYVGESDLEAYVASLSSVFSMKTRATDPFGQLQDPDAKPIVKPTMAKTTKRVTSVQVTPFSEIIRLIQVTTIMPGERGFLIGTRSFKQGDSFPINFRGRSIKVEVCSVSSRQIDFRNVESGETASIKLNLLPAGMTPGTTGKITAPGMVADHPNSPLEIESGEAATANSQN